MEKPVDKKEKGWARIYRSIQEHWLWEEKPFSSGQAWIDLILLAGYEDKKLMLQNPKVLVSLPRGSLLTSETKLSERWGWSRRKVHSFLDILEQDEMIFREKAGKGTVLKLRNYGVFHDFLGEVEPDKHRTSTGHARDTHRTSTGHAHKQEGKRI